VFQKGIYVDPITGMLVSPPDRASRVTLQSFKMYLAKGIEGFEKMPIGPGQVFSTENPQASIESFGGDAQSPSEESPHTSSRSAMPLGLRLGARR